ncbi:MAG: cyclic pyranopterin monophosphate synthase MoaC [Promethearchaeota archaeon Loki_b32]|nr:MAG: cyclic pyranopterin monophosphate synthase MoaC [Candidatus Lokiarchaeota archaeon Loki_b32]
MIDISKKESIARSATASGKIILKKETINRIKNRQIKKGDAFTIAKVSAINAVKKVPDLIPFCHPIPIDNIDINFTYENNNSIKVTCKVKSIAKTGVEMEALTGVSVALLNLWDVIKMYEKDKDGQYPMTKIYDIIVEIKVKDK